MYLVTSKEMREIDRNAIEKIGIPSEVLMENAGISVARRIKERFRNETHLKVVILSGHGNNGGDGFVVARHLGNAGYNVETWLVGDEQKLSRESRVHFNSLVNSGYRVEKWDETRFDVLMDRMTDASVIVDALLGIGASGPLRQPYKKIIDYANGLNNFRVAVDLPSGVICDTGHVNNSAFLASMTVTFVSPKLGHLLFPGADYVGELFVEDISIPPIILKKTSLSKQLITSKIVRDKLPIRSSNTHKGTYGHALIIGGSKDMPGAPTLATKAALRAGVGLATIAIPKSIQSMVFSHVSEAICIGLPEKESGNLSINGIETLFDKSKKYEALCYGVGIGLWEEGYNLLKKILDNLIIPIVIDADGINVLSNKLDILRNREYPIILTPHPGEMARLIKNSVDFVQQNRIGVTQELAREYGIYVVLKGANTVIATPEGEIYINQTGGTELAKGGTGDVLAGMITSFIAQKLSVKSSVLVAVYLHGLAGSLAVKSTSNYSIIATDIIEKIGPAIYHLMSNHAD